MKRLILAVTFSTIASIANADVVTLKCEGKNDAGKTYTEVIHFNPDQGWVKLDYFDMKMTGAVTAKYIDVFLIKMKINRETGEFTKVDTDKSVFIGQCAKNDTKF